jgi:hypothetical protein
MFVAGLLLGILIMSATQGRRDRNLVEGGTRQERLRIRQHIKSRIEELRRLVGVPSPLAGEVARAELAELEHTLLWGAHDHREHGRSSDGHGPDDPDCPCRGHHPEAECALQGCGFCAAARTERARRSWA